MSNDNEIEFVDGLIVKAPRENAPSFVKASLSFKREALIAWLQARDGEWVNVDVKEAKSGKWYAAVDSWKPSEGRSNAPQREPARQAPPTDDFIDDEIPW